MDSNPSASEPTEPALIYDAGERRTHAEHAAKAYDMAQRADAMHHLADGSGMWRHRRAMTEARAQWHATMALYESAQSRAVEPEATPAQSRRRYFTDQERALIRMGLDAAIAGGMVGRDAESNAESLFAEFSQ